LEVLLTTPVRIGEWAAAQWDFLKRVMTLPLLLMLTPTLFQALFLLAEGRLRAGATAYGLLVLINAWQTVAGVAALCWLSLLLAFGGIGQGRTILWTILIAEGVPYAVTVMWGLFCHAVVAKLTGSANVWTSPGFWVGSLLPQLVTVMFYLWVIRVARSHLLHQNLRGELYDVGRLIRLSFAGVQAVPGHPGECRTG
jgi:hypothetical protein